MSTLQMLDVVIGLVFIFLLLSLICTALNEILETFLKMRASDLERGIRELLQDPGLSIDGLAAKLYKHPIIAGLYRGQYKPASKKLPSYIPASNFSLALMDVILQGTASDPKAPAGKETPPLSVESLRNAVITAWPAEKDQRAILSLIDVAKGDIDQARTNIENWYNSAMDRVAGWYKRRVQIILLVVGLILAIAMNADTIAIFKSLVNDPPLRNSLVAAAQEYAKTPDATASPGNTAQETPEQRIDANAKKLYDLRLPIGWDWSPPSEMHQMGTTALNSYRNNYSLAIPWADETHSLRNWILKILGWLFTALAVSLGAPFWFDVLNRVMVIRSTVKPHEKSPEEASEDRQKGTGRRNPASQNTTE